MRSPDRRIATDGPETALSSTEEDGMRSVQLLLSGRVQGVGYRAWCERTATTAGLVGFCRNLVDGRVEAFAQGDDGDVAAFIAACRRGPPHAVVGDIVVVDRPPRALRRFDAVASADAPDVG